MIVKRPDSATLKLTTGWMLLLAGIFPVFFLLTFPYDALQARILAEASARTGLAITAERWASAWPLGVEWRGVTVSPGDTVRAQVDWVRVHVGLLKTLTGRPAAEIVAQLPGGLRAGSGQATIQLAAEAWTPDAPLFVAGRIDRLDLSSLAAQAVRRGSFSADFTQQWTPQTGSESPLSGEGVWKLEAADLLIELPSVGQARLPSLALSDAKATVRCRAAVCRIQELRGTGPDGFFSGEGQVTLQQPFGRSALSLSLTVTASAEFAQRAAAQGLPIVTAGSPVKLVISGSVAQPRIALGHAQYS